jgi:ABC-type uncharacterized transport system substrate-binding protein
VPALMQRGRQRVSSNPYVPAFHIVYTFAVARWVHRMDRRDFIALAGGAIAGWPQSVRAQHTKRWQIGFLYPGPKAAASQRIKAVITGLQASGLRLQDQFTIVPGLTDGNVALLGSTAAELLARPVDLILAVGPAAVRAARDATSTMPIIAIDLESDPVASGFIVSLARPGRNITGIFLDFPDFSKKWLELLNQTIPTASLIAIFWDPASGELQLRAAEAAARSLNLRTSMHEVSTSVHLEGAFQSANSQRADALLILPSPLVGGSGKSLAELSTAHRLPAITLFTDFARQGGLLAYGPNLLTSYRQLGVVMAKLLKGANVAEVPVERPTKFEFVLNLKAAEALGITIPPSILLRADEVID